MPSVSNGSQSAATFFSKPPISAADAMKLLEGQSLTDTRMSTAWMASDPQQHIMMWSRQGDTPTLAVALDDLDQFSPDTCYFVLCIRLNVLPRSEKESPFERFQRWAPSWNRNERKIYDDGRDKRLVREEHESRLQVRYSGLTVASVIFIAYRAAVVALECRMERSLSKTNTNSLTSLINGVAEGSKKSSWLNIETIFCDSSVDSSDYTDSSDDDDPSHTSQFAGWSSADMVRHFDPICSKIEDWIYLGSKTPSEDKEMMKSLGITHIMNCVGMLCPDKFPRDFKYMNMYLLDGGSQDITGLFWLVVDFFEKARHSKGKIYVHCHQGVSRSTAMVICYLMWSNHASFSAVFEDVKKKSPNASFIAQLLGWGKRLGTEGEKAKQNTKRLFRMAWVSPNQHFARLTSLDDQSKLLDPRSTFILQTSDVIYLWKGSQCSDDFWESGIQNAELLMKYEVGRTLKMIQLTQEECEEGTTDSSLKFWELLGGKKKVEIQKAYDHDFARPRRPSWLDNGSVS
ncbi:hypothetical protein PROFUN_00048 [Planoprotostelium fungivorum]|uniref:Uncharacterized protein n=1 Tax=Planoprotostelium fungivorum TaxID=1890364 RepID=A0A2P6P0H2_9EUKA|nr:hypothetical protein PROFUN_00048 [Planoprotostelium fungivorum]